MNNVAITFEVDNTQPEWLYWMVIKIGGMPVGHIAKNHNVDTGFLLAVYNYRFPGEQHRRITYTRTCYFDTVAECKEEFFKVPVGELLGVSHADVSTGQFA